MICFFVLDLSFLFVLGIVNIIFFFVDYIFIDLMVYFDKENFFIFMQVIFIDLFYNFVFCLRNSCLFKVIMILCFVVICINFIILLFEFGFIFILFGIDYFIQCEEWVKIQFFFVIWNLVVIRLFV